MKVAAAAQRSFEVGRDRRRCHSDTEAEHSHSTSIAHAGGWLPLLRVAVP